jgi:hypothetical protein
MTTLALGQYNPLYFAQSIAFGLLSNIPKKTLAVLPFQISVWYRMNSFIYVSFNFSKVLYVIAFANWCLSHNILFSSEFDDYSIACANLLLVAIS